MPRKTKRVVVCASCRGTGGSYERISKYHNDYDVQWCCCHRCQGAGKVDLAVEKRKAIRELTGEVAYMRREVKEAGKDLAKAKRELAQTIKSLDKARASLASV